MSRVRSLLTARRRETLAVATAYALLSLALFGRGVLADPTGSVVGAFGSDQGVFMWSLEWWPHAISHGIHTMHTDLVYAPTGWNLAWTTVIPGPALLLAPITLSAGPIVAYNLLALAAPALDATCAFLLARELTGRRWPSIMGGLVFGFSTYVASQTLNHVNLALVFPLPLAALVILRHARGTTSDRRFVASLAVVLVAEFSIFLETFLTLVLAIAAGLLIAIVAAPRVRRRAILRTIGASGAAFGVCLVVVSPYLYEVLAGENPLAGGVIGAHYPLDLANILVPTSVTALHIFATAGAERLKGNATEQSGYIGPVALAALALVPLALRRSRVAIGTLVFAALWFGAALGPDLYYFGERHGRLPLAPFLHLPLIRHALPVRFSVYLWLALAILVALLLATLPRAVGVVLALGLLVTLCPAPDRDRWVTPVVTPSFFKDGTWREFIKPDENVLVIPIGFQDNAMFWQAQAGFGYRMTGGYVASTIPDLIWRFPIVWTMYGMPLPDHPVDELRRFLHDRQVDVVVLRDGASDSERLAPVLATLGPGRQVGGVTVWRVPPWLKAPGTVTPTGS